MHQQLTRCLEEGLSPEEAYGVVAVIRGMRRNKNLLLRTQDVEGPERFCEYRDEEGWTYHDILRGDQLTKEHGVREIDVPKGKYRKAGAKDSREQASQTLPPATMTKDTRKRNPQNHQEWRCARWSL